MNIPVYFDGKLALTMSATFINADDDNDPSVMTDNPVPVTIGPDGKIPSVTIGAPWYSHATDNIAFSYRETAAGDEIEVNAIYPPLPPLTSVNLEVSTGAPKGPANDALISRLESLFHERDVHPSQRRETDDRHPAAYDVHDKINISFRRNDIGEYGKAISTIANAPYEVNALTLQPHGLSGGPSFHSLASARELFPINAPPDITICVDNSRTNNSHGFAGPDHSQLDEEMFTDIKGDSPPTTHRMTFAMETECLPKVEDIVAVLQYREGLEYKFTVGHEDSAWPQDKTVYSRMVNHGLRSKYNANQSCVS